MSSSSIPPDLPHGTLAPFPPTRLQLPVMNVNHQNPQVSIQLGETIDYDRSDLHVSQGSSNYNPSSSNVDVKDDRPPTTLNVQDEVVTITDLSSPRPAGPASSHSSLAYRQETTSLLRDAHFHPVHRLTLIGMCSVTLIQAIINLIVFGIWGSLDPSKCEYSLSIWILIHLIKLLINISGKITTYSLIKRGTLDTFRYYLRIRPKVLLLDRLLTSVLLIAGTAVIAEYESCSPTSHQYYSAAIAILVISWAIFAMPVFAVCCVLPIMACCAPVILRLFPSMRITRSVDLARPRGAAPQQIEDITLISYVPKAEKSDTGEMSQDSKGQHTVECAICLKDFVAGDSCRLLPCDHMFHQECVDPWLRINGSCCTCRHPIGINYVPPCPSSSAVSSPTSLAP